MANPERRIAVVDDARFDAHRPRGEHPERPERLEAARSGLLAGLPESARIAIPATALDDRDLARVHGQAYVDRLHQALSSGWGNLDPDTYFSPGSHEAVFAAAGGAASMARALMRNQADGGFALLRPPGHHATPTQAMGFCMINNVALAATAALDAGAERVAIVDWDVHHGNGTQDAFEDDPRVLFVSLHQWPFYPGSGRPEEVGRGHGAGRTINVAVPAGAGIELYGDAFRRLVLPVLESFRADIVLVSAGFDAHHRDPLASLELDRHGFAAMASALRRHVDQLGHGRLGLLLEGGYDLNALEESVEAVTRALRGETTELPEDRVRDRDRDAVDRTIAAIAPHWPDVDWVAGG